MKLYKIENAREYFKEIIKKTANKKIVKIFTFGSNCSDKSYKYQIDTPLYIEFEDQSALIIEYYEVCLLNVEYRMLTKDEIEKLAKIDCKDLFNRTDEIYNFGDLKLTRRETLTMTYDTLKDVYIGN